MKNRFHDTTVDYVIFTFWVYYILHPVCYTMITKILSRKYKTILYILQLLVQVIFKEFDVLFLQLNKNMTTDCHWVYAFCTSNWFFLFDCTKCLNSMTISFHNMIQLKKRSVYRIENDL